MIPLYILGLLQRFGPQHGYQLKKVITEKIADFTRIKLPAIYYHLEKMEKDGLLTATREKPGSRPEKTVYAVSDKGAKAFLNMLNASLEFDYQPVFACDAAFYFNDSLQLSQIITRLEEYSRKLAGIITYLQEHQKTILRFVPDNDKTIINILFRHHELHHRAELNWAVESLNSLKNRRE